MRFLILLTFSFPFISAQANNSSDNDEIVFSRGGFDFLPDNDKYEEVPTKPPDDLGALTKCGEREDAGIHLCVPYYMCDGATNTIVRDGKTDGFGIIDIRFGANSCDHPLDVCCKIPEGGLPTPSSSTETPVTSDEPVTPDDGTYYCGIRNLNGIDFKITGNNDNEAEYGEFPWMVAILRKHYDPSVDKSLAICGGSLITPNVVLTGAHCVYKFKTNEIKIRAGEWDTQTDKERLPYQERGVADIIIHNKFKPEVLFNDVALVILESPFNRAEHIGTICLPTQGQHIDSQNCFASGWGKDKFGKEGQYQVILKKIELPIVPHSQCEESLRTTRLGKHFVLDTSFTCAGGIEGRDTCTGDGGSPLICPDPENPSRYVQAGLVAWGIGCGEKNVPGVYADVTKFREWIDDNLQRLNFDTRPYYV